jgi:hypothetical protein
VVICRLPNGNRIEMNGSRAFLAAGVIGTAPIVIFFSGTTGAAGQCVSCVPYRDYKSAKLAVTALCFWYLAKNIDVRVLAGETLHFSLVCLAIIVLMAQIPLVGLGWRYIVDALSGNGDKLPVASAIACTAVTSFFSQIVPNIGADAVRVWMLTQLGRGWRPPA